MGGKLGARGLHDILLYHMAISDLYAAGCPNGARLTEFPGWPTDEEAHARIQEALPYLPLVRNTSSSWAVRIILGDLILAVEGRQTPANTAVYDDPKVAADPVLQAFRKQVEVAVNDGPTSPEALKALLDPPDPPTPGTGVRCSS